MKHVDLWVTLDMERSVDQAEVRVPRLDNWRRIILRLRNGDAPYELPEGAMASWSLDRMGKGVNLNEIAATVSTLVTQNDGEEDPVTEQIVILQWQDEWTRISGAFRAIVHLIGSGGEDLWTPTFQFIVTESPYDDAVVRESPQFSALVQARLEFLEKVAEVNAFMESAVTEEELLKAVSGEETSEEVMEAIGVIFGRMDRPVYSNISANFTISVKEAVKAVIRYALDHSLYESQQDAAAFNTLYVAALSALDSAWLNDGYATGTAIGYHEQGDAPTPGSGVYVDAEGFLVIPGNEGTFSGVVSVDEDGFLNLTGA